MIQKRRVRDTLLTSTMVFFALFRISLGQQMTPSASPIELRELVDSGQKYANQLVQVRGCFIHEFEISVLQPCGSKFSQFSRYSLWVDDIDGRCPGDLWNLTASREHPVAVVLQGQFQASKSRKYGHLNCYRWRFIVYKLITAGAVENSEQTQGRDR
jgi:hypothetical protein